LAYKKEHSKSLKRL